MYAGAAVVVGGVITAIWLKRKKDGDNGTLRKRRMSFNSANLVEGTFPEKDKVIQPVINTVLYFKKCPSDEAIEATFRELLFYDRFRSCITRDKSGSIILKDLGASINFAKHILHCHTVKSEKEMMEKIDLVACKTVISMENGPLWQVHRYNNSGGKSSVVIRVHHAIGDGISLVGSMSKVFKKLDGTPFSSSIPENMGKSKTKQAVLPFLKSLVEVLGLANSSFDSDLVFTSQDKKNLVSGPRQTIMFPTLNLTFVKAVKDATKTTVNDVLLAATSGALLRYCQERDDALLKGDCSKILSRCLLPIAFPRPTRDTESPAKGLRNLFALVSARMPTNATTPLQRLTEANSIMSRLKTSGQHIIQYFLQAKLMTHLPLFINRQIAHDVFCRHTMVFSNVPGPSETLTCCGEEINGIHAFFPNYIPQVIIVSYANKVYYSLNVDPDIVTNGEALGKAYLAEIIELAKNVGVNTNLQFVLSE